MNKLNEVAEFHRNLINRLAEEVPMKFLDWNGNELKTDSVIEVFETNEDFNAKVGTPNYELHIGICPYPQTTTDIYVCGFAKTDIGMNDMDRIERAKEIVREEAAKHPSWYVPDSIIDHINSSNRKVDCVVYELDYGFTSYE